MTEQIVFSLCLSTLYFMLVWLVTLVTGKLVMTQIFWSLGFLIPFAVDFYLDGPKHGNIIMFALVLLWALRHAIYHSVRIQKSTYKDPRHTLLARNWKPHHFKINSLVYVVIPQWFCHILLCSAFYIYLASPSSGWSAPWWNVPMLWIFLVGLGIETLADLQLYFFKRNFENLSLTYTGGLWRWIKYPNYLGELLVWLSFGLLALPFTYGYWGLISPLVSLYLLVFWAGVPYLEEKREAQKSFPHPRPKYKLIPWVL